MWKIHDYETVPETMAYERGFRHGVMAEEIRAYGRGFHHGLAVMFVCCLIGWAAFPIIFVLLLLEKW